MRTDHLRTLIALSLLLIAGVAGCTDDPAGPAPTPVDGTNTTSFNVTWSPSAVVFKTTEMADLNRIDSATFVFYFKSTSQKAATLKTGSILVVGDYAIRKVKSVENAGGEFVVKTEAAELTEAITDGDIAWDYGVDISAQAIGKTLGKQMGAKVTGSNDSLVVSFAHGSYEVELTIKSKPGETSFEGKMSKEIIGGSGAKGARFAMAGTVKKYRSTGAIKIRGSKIQQFDVDNNNIVADFTVTALAAGFGNDIGIEIPVPLLSYPIPQLPFFMFDLKALLVLNASIPTDGSCDLGIRLQYVSNQGFQFDPVTKNIRPRSTVTWKGFTPTKPPQTAASGPIGVSFGIAFPRTELNITGTKTGAWIHLAGLIGGDFTMFPVCRTAKASAIVAGGLTVGVDGLNTGIKKTLWQKDTTFLKSGECP